MTAAAQNGPDEAVIPEWDLADRLTKAMRIRGIAVADMAEILGVSRQTVGRWINGHSEPSKPVLFYWATLTGVDLAWLTGGDGSARSEGFEPPTF